MIHLIRSTVLLCAFAATSAPAARAAAVCLPSGIHHVNIQDALDAPCAEIELRGPVFTENITIRTAVTITGPNANPTTIRAAASGAPVVHVDGVAGAVVLDNVRITDGANTGDCGGGISIENSPDVSLQGVVVEGNAAAHGGGICVEDSTVAATSSRLEGNQATVFGGGAYLQDSALLIDGSDITENTAINGAGVSAWDSEVTVQNSSVFSYNDASATGGGFALIDGILEITDATFSDNSATYHGGGIYALASRNGFWEVNVTGSTLQDNTAANGAGAYAIKNSTSGRLDVGFTGTTWSGNQSGDLGGGLYGEGLSELVIDGGTFTDNAASCALGSDGGGAIFAYEVRDLTISGSAFTGNTSECSGGAILASAGSALNTSFDLSGSTFDQNSAAESGGGLHLSSFDAADIASTDFSQNEALCDALTTGGGGAIYAASVLEFGIDGGAFTANESALAGGALFAGGQGALVVDGTSWDQNIAEENGGGAYLKQLASASFSETTFTSNAATFNGGGLMLQSVAAAEITYSGFYANGAGGYGGGIGAAMTTFQDAAFTSGDLDISYTEIGEDTAASLSGNTADTGGGLAVASYVVTIEDSYVHENEAISDGGGAYIGYQADTGVSWLRRAAVDSNTAGADGAGLYVVAFNDLDVINTTLSRNDAGASGGGLYSHGSNVDFTHATIYENQVGSTNDGYSIFTATSGDTASLANSVAFTQTISAGISECAGSGTVSLSDADHNIVSADDTCGGGTTESDPMIVGPGSDPTTGVYFLLDALGPAADAVAPGSCTIPEDQLGTTRGLLCDIGAIEISPLN